MKKTWHGVLPGRGDADACVSTLLPICLAAIYLNYDDSIFIPSVFYPAPTRQESGNQTACAGTLVLRYCMWGKVPREGSASYTCCKLLRHLVQYRLCEK